MRLSSFTSVFTEVVPMRKRRVVGRIYGMRYRWKGHKDRNRHNNRLKWSGQARSIPTTWRWALGNISTSSCIKIMVAVDRRRVQPKLLSSYLSGPFKSKLLSSYLPGPFKSIAPIGHAFIYGVFSFSNISSVQRYGVRVTVASGEGTPKQK